MEKKIRYLLVLPFFYPHRGGSQKYAEELLARVSKLHSNVTVDVLCYNTDNVAKEENYRGFNIYRIPCVNLIPARFALPNPISLLKLLSALSKNKYDFVNTHIRFFDPAWWLWIYARFIGAKSILTEHVAQHPVHQNKFVEVIAKIVDLTIVKFSLQRYDYLTFTNKSAQNQITNSNNIKSETFLFYGGIDTKVFKSTDKNTVRTLPKNGLSISPNTILVTYVGRLIWTKGITYYYDAIKSLLKENGGNLLFVLAGPGELEEEVKTLIKKDNLESKIVLTGDLDYKQVQDLLSISNIFVNPSHHNEGFPNTVLEAGASEAFVIATDNAGTSEVINKDTGILIPQKDTKAINNALFWAINNPKQATKISHNFREILVNNFDWDLIAERFYKFLQDKS